MDSILQSIQDLEGVNGTFVADGAGQLLGYKAHQVYDLDLLQQVAKFVNSAIDSIKLLQEDWNSVNGQFSEGKLLIRSIGASKQTAVLVVIADSRLNVSFAGVAIRVAVSKLKSLIDSGAVPAAGAIGQRSAAGSNVSQLPGPGSTGFTNAPSQMASPRQGGSEVASSGLSWSGLSGTSSMSGSGVYVTDLASAEFLSACAKVLARSVGPMAKLYVKEAVKKLFPARPFSREHGDELIGELAQHINNPAEAAQFRTQVLKAI